MRIKRTWGKNKGIRQASELLDHARRMESERSDALLELESFCLSCNLHTGLAPDAEVYRRVQKDHGGAVAEAWRIARALLAKAGK